MKNYLAYLEKLQKEMVIESEVDYDKLYEWVDKRDTWSSRGDYAKITAIACFLTSLMLYDVGYTWNLCDAHCSRFDSDFRERIYDGRESPIWTTC